MKKLSKLMESVWSDMQDRGAGDMIKKEDDINLLDGEEFAEYLKKLYKNVDTPFKIFIDVENVITVPILKSTKGQLICVHYDCTNNIVYGKYDFLYYHDPDLFEKLRKDYKTFMLKKSFATYVRFEPRVGEFSNEFFIEIIDFYLENCNTTDSNIKRILVKNVNESIWSDMQDRGSGDMIKKEDDIDLLDFDQFYEYLNNRYQTCYTNQNIDRITGSLNYIAVPLLCGRSISQLAIYKDPRIKPYIFIKDVDLYPELLNTFSLNYDITIDDVEKGWKSIYIYTKGKRNQDEKHPNSFYVQLIDYILDMDKPEQLKNMLKRNVNESIWSDMQDRGTGDKIKEEDSIDRFEKDQLMDYLRDTYEPLGGTFISGGSKSIYIPFDKPLKKTWTEQCICIVFDDNNDKDITKLKLFGIDSSKLADIKNILNDFYIEYARSGGVVTLTPKTGKLTNSICVDVLDKMLEIAQKPYYRKQ